MVSSTIQVEATGELTTLTETGVATYRFERILPESPIVMMLHLNQDDALPGLSTARNVKLKMSLEFPDDTNEKMSIMHIQV